MINATYDELASAGAIRAGDMTPQSARRGLVGVVLAAGKGLISAIQTLDGRASLYLADLANARNHAARFVDEF